MLSIILTEKRARQRELDMDCQRHNSEAVIKGMDEKLKEKDKEHRFGLIYNLICMYYNTIKEKPSTLLRGILHDCRFTVTCIVQ